MEGIPRDQTATDLPTFFIFCGCKFLKKAGAQPISLLLTRGYDDKFFNFVLAIGLGAWYNRGMKATKKDPKIDQFLFSMFGRDRTATVSDGLCVTCPSKGNVASSFRDDLSKKEYAISGMCQSCQDDFFGTSEK